MQIEKKHLTLEELAILESEMFKKSKSKDAAWGLWAGLSFFGAHRFYTEDYRIASIMLSTTIFPLFLLILVLAYSLSDGLLYFSLFFLIGSVIWSWIDAFFLNRRIEALNDEIEQKILVSIKKN
ncbi:NINE protein [Bacillus suaedaesalsae]|uniref:TM2 domain-containing protein n=1 Tax=Bacillus suaedaesalsae TaxID=2810349 RepID=A0ABS2DKV8_9BACI|nr:NINE protein [Bacillus suaedaesalsae]MBM6619120.1 TM2 domain-containing protein [Bacillus suaedaesalsae]